MERARTLAAGPTVAYGMAKDLFYHSLNNQLETQLELEAKRIIAAARTEDFREGTRAFTEKRPAVYRGR
jgi:2-(1,2-epoxy-1,2-dihydrophenyl)acetyl-CoA isomerase